MVVDGKFCDPLTTFPEALPADKLCLLRSNSFNGCHGRSGKEKHLHFGTHLPQKPEPKGLALRLDKIKHPAGLRQSSGPCEPST